MSAQGLKKWLDILTPKVKEGTGRGKPGFGTVCPGCGKSSEECECEANTHRERKFMAQLIGCVLIALMLSYCSAIPTPKKADNKCQCCKK